MRFINVVITDGNRTVNYDCKTGITLAYLLKGKRFHWLRGSVRVNGVRIPDEMVKATLEDVQAFSMTVRKDTGRMKITCETPANDPSKLSLKKLKKQERNNERASIESA